jgi:hypothetical protein
MPRHAETEKNWMELTMEPKAKHRASKERVVQLASSSWCEDDDGDLVVVLEPEEVSWTLSSGVRLTRNDGLNLLATLAEALSACRGKPRPLIRLWVPQSPADVSVRPLFESVAPADG